MIRKFSCLVDLNSKTTTSQDKHISLMKLECPQGIELSGFTRPQEIWEIFQYVQNIHT